MQRKFIVVIKPLCKNIITIMCYTFFILFLFWLVLGLGYRFFCQDKVHERQQSMLNMLTDIKVFNKYTLRKIEPQQVSRALISQVCKAYFDANQSESESICEIEEYLLENCWNVKKTRHKDGTYSLEGKKEDFIVVIENVDEDAPYNLIVTIKYDDFFTRYSL